MRYLAIILSISILLSNIKIFDGDKAFSYIKEQCDFGPRYPGSEGHNSCKKYLIDQVDSYCKKTIVDEHLIMDPLTLDSVKIYNIFGKINPEINHSWSDKDIKGFYNSFKSVIKEYILNYDKYKLITFILKISTKHKIPEKISNEVIKTIN